MLKILKLIYYQNCCTDSNQILHSDEDHQILVCPSIVRIERMDIEGASRSIIIMIIPSQTNRYSALLYL